MPHPRRWGTVGGLIVGDAVRHGVSWCVTDRGRAHRGRRGAAAALGSTLVLFLPPPAQRDVTVASPRGQLAASVSSTNKKTVWWCAMPLLLHMRAQVRFVDFRDNGVGGGGGLGAAAATQAASGGAQTMAQHLAASGVLLPGSGASRASEPAAAARIVWSNGEVRRRRVVSDDDALMMMTR